ncbi:uncharacterized protein LOC122059262 [Macadamia integrifolia]|uniref:uncharacterized protein LOC122059262 n=1 Tax=Macadamia integrifolia TaxID=60698 RepID=UPI001C52F2C1|nr:uncharacterized protein LOC122059262 [Macadamia integrifolia]
MASQLIDQHREKAEIYHGDTLCKQKSIELLSEMELPKGLLPLSDMEEVGYNRETGFVWLKQKKSTEHIFRKISRKVSYGSEITAFVEPRKFKKLSGVKSKELLIWITLSDIYIDNPSSGKITFMTPAGLSRTFPVSAFDLEEDEGAAKEAEKEKKKKEEEAAMV